MTYRITGLAYEPFADLFDLSDAELESRKIRRVFATSDRGYPCRVSLGDARAGDELLLLNHVSHDVATPYRSAYAIYVKRDAQVPAAYVDEEPPVFAGRPLGLRGFGADGMLKDARLAMPGEADARIRDLLADPRIATIHAHNAAHGCFVARIERHDSGDAG